MKKVIVVVFLILVLNYLCGISSNNKKTFEEKKENNEIHGIYISYIDLEDHFKNKNDEEIKIEIDKMINNLYNDKFNLIVLHVRSFSDSLYNSSIYPLSYVVKGEEGARISFDILKYFIEKSHDKKIKLYAWINPYRIKSSSDIESINIKNPAFKYIGTNNISVVENKGIFYNPASSEVTKLIVSGVSEIVKNYEVDGVVMDDYFYPDDKIDLNNYNEYKNNGGNLDLNNYRLEIINNMIKEVYKEIKSVNKNIIFGIAPDANIENNYNNNYADIKTWLSSDQYIDIIMPQIYYGFMNQNKPYIKVLNEWNNLIKNDDIKLVPSLAFYKIGNIDKYALSGKYEWINSYNILRNQVLVSRNMNKYNGFILFRYDSLYNNNEKMIYEKEELLSIM